MGDLQAFSPLPVTSISPSNPSGSASPSALVAPPSASAPPSPPPAMALSLAHPVGDIASTAPMPMTATAEATERDRRIIPSQLSRFGGSQEEGKMGRSREPTEPTEPTE